MISPQEAFNFVVGACSPLLPRTIPLADATGMILAEEIAADRDFPPFNRSMMDGYAVRLTDAGKCIPVAGELPAGVVWTMPWPQGTCIEIMTGAACPPGVEAVVPKEHVERAGNKVVLPRELTPGANIAPRASECPAGRIVLSPGQTLTPLAIAVAAAVGKTELSVIPRPNVAVLVTGEELASESEIPECAKIRDSNGPMLVALTHAAGLQPSAFDRVSDNESAILDGLERFSNCEILVLSGGVSAGNYDLVPKGVKSWGGDVIFHYVKQKPGKPLFFARRKEQLIFGLPGNPLACHFCFQRYVAAAIDVLQGKNPHAREFSGTLNAEIRAKPGRTTFMPGLCIPSNSGPSVWHASPMSGVSSADIFSLTKANCFIEVPPREAPWPAGSSLPCHWFLNHCR